MAIPTNIKNLLSGNVVEWARIEFKATWDPAASLKSVCALSTIWATGATVYHHRCRRGERSPGVHANHQGCGLSEQEVYCALVSWR